MSKQVFIFLSIIVSVLFTNSLLAQNLPFDAEAKDTINLSAFYIPSASSIIVNYFLPEKSAIKLMIYSADERFGKVLSCGTKEAGKYCEYFTISNLIPGNYFYQLQTEIEIITKSIMLKESEIIE